jgi:cytochrome c biogenesis protein
MRFAIALLSLICIASVVGTVLKQGEPYGNYVNQFGPFWAEFFAAMSLYTVYSAWWFLLILAFLVISVSLCIARNAPKILADLRTLKEHVRAQSLRAFGHRATAELTEAPEVAAQRMGAQLAQAGWKVKLQHRPERGWMVAARAGGVNKLGYLAAHSAIVLVCIGGLLDGDLMVRMQMWFNGKSVHTGGGLISDVKPEHRLSQFNPTFRANLFVSEGTSSGNAVLTLPQGVLIQELPFSVELKKFIVEYYPTGMPKLFASDIVIHDRETQAKTEARVEVNHPARYKGIEIYQSSFDDGGSRVKLRSVAMQGNAASFDVEGNVGGKTELVKGAGDEKLALEFTGLRLINVENVGGTKAEAPASDASAATPSADGKVDARGVNFGQTLNKHLGAANKPDGKKNLRNVGPSVSYKLRDAAGQAREFNNYMLPVDTGDGNPVFLLGSRELPSEAFRYVRVPADDQGSIDGFARLRAALQDDGLRNAAVQRFARQAMEAGKPDPAQQLEQSAQRALALFAGLESINGKKVMGLQALSDFIETAVPEAERSRAGEVLVRIVNGVLYELMLESRRRAKLPDLPTDAASLAKTQAFMTQAVFALSDAQFYPAPMAMMLSDFTHVQASVFQVARAPGKNIVYLGCALLILGVFAMLYVRERRLWVWIEPGANGNGTATMALSSNRKTLDTDREFSALKIRLLGLP